MDTAVSDARSSAQCCTPCALARSCSRAAARRWVLAGAWHRAGLVGLSAASWAPDTPARTRWLSLQPGCLTGMFEVGCELSCVWQCSCRACCSQPRPPPAEGTCSLWLSSLCLPGPALWCGTLLGSGPWASSGSLQREERSVLV